MFLKSLRSQIWLDMVITPQFIVGNMKERSLLHRSKLNHIIWRNNQSNYYPNVKLNISGKAECMTIRMEEKDPVFADFSCNDPLSYICLNSK